MPTYIMSNQYRTNTYEYGLKVERMYYEKYSLGFSTLRKNINIYITLY